MWWLVCVYACVLLPSDAAVEASVSIRLRMAAMSCVSSALSVASLRGPDSLQRLGG